MQLTIRGQESYMLDFNGDETFADLKNRVCEQEKTEVLLYVSGKPLPDEGVVSSIENCAIDVTVPLLGGKVRCSQQIIECLVCDYTYIIIRIKMLLANWTNNNRKS